MTTETQQDARAKPAKPAKKPHRIWPVLVGVVLIAIAVICLVSVIGAYLSQFNLIRVQATVTSRTCKFHSGSGEDSGYTTCTVNLSYREPGYDSPGFPELTVVFNDVDISRIHGQNSGHEWMNIYFSDPSSDPISPEDNMPWWAVALVAIPATALGIGGFVCTWRGFRPKRPKGKGHVPDPTPQSGKEVNQPSWEEANRRFWEERTTPPDPQPDR